MQEEDDRQPGAGAAEGRRRARSPAPQGEAEEAAAEAAEEAAAVAAAEASYAFSAIPREIFHYMGREMLLANGLLSVSYQMRSTQELAAATEREAEEAAVRPPALRLRRVDREGQAVAVAEHGAPLLPAYTKRNIMREQILGLQNHRNTLYEYANMLCAGRGNRLQTFIDMVRRTEPFDAGEAEKAPGSPWEVALLKTVIISIHWFEIEHIMRRACLDEKTMYWLVTRNYLHFVYREDAEECEGSAELHIYLEAKGKANNEWEKMSKDIEKMSKDVKEGKKSQEIPPKEIYTKKCEVFRKVYCLRLVFSDFVYNPRFNGVHPWTPTKVAIVSPRGNDNLVYSIKYNDRTFEVTSDYENLHIASEWFFGKMPTNRSGNDMTMDIFGTLIDSMSPLESCGTLLQETEFDDSGMFHLYSRGFFNYIYSSLILLAPPHRYPQALMSSRVTSAPPGIIPNAPLNPSFNILPPENAIMPGFGRLSRETYWAYLNRVVFFKIPFFRESDWVPLVAGVTTLKVTDLLHWKSPERQLRLNMLPSFADKQKMGIMMSNNKGKKLVSLVISEKDDARKEVQELLGQINYYNDVILYLKHRRKGAAIDPSKANDVLIMNKCFTCKRAVAIAYCLGCKNQFCDNKECH